MMPDTFIAELDDSITKRLHELPTLNVGIQTWTQIGRKID